MAGKAPHSSRAGPQRLVYRQGVGTAALMLLDLGAVSSQIHTDAHGSLQTIAGTP